MYKRQARAIGQAHQIALAEIEFRIVTDQEITKDQEQGLIKVVQQALSYPFTITVVQSRERLAAGPNGKFEEFICKVA